MSVKPALQNFEVSSGFRTLFGEFEKFEVTPALEEISRLLSEAEIGASDIAPFRVFSDERYTRTRLFRSQFVEVLVLGWNPRQRSRIHDHDGSVGAVRVVEGAVAETKYEWDGDGYLLPVAKTEVGVGGVAGVGEPDIHLLENVGGDDDFAVTVHVYAPPLEGINVYDLETREINFYLLD